MRRQPAMLHVIVTTLIVVSCPYGRPLASFTSNLVLASAAVRVPCPHLPPVCQSLSHYRVASLTPWLTLTPAREHLTPAAPALSQVLSLMHCSHALLPSHLLACAAPIHTLLMAGGWGQAAAASHSDPACVLSVRCALILLAPSGTVVWHYAELLMVPQ